MPEQDAGARVVARLNQIADMPQVVGRVSAQITEGQARALAEFVAAACAMRAFALVKPRLGSIAWNEQANKVDVAFDTALAALAAALGTEGEKDV